MNRFWILFVFAVAVSAVSAQNNDGEFPDYEYDSQWYNDEIEKLGVADYNDKSSQQETVDGKIDQSAESKEFNSSEVNADEKVDKEIQQFLGAPNKVINDYQIEDNRFKPELDYDDSETQIIDENDDVSSQVEPMNEVGDDQISANDENDLVSSESVPINNLDDDQIIENSDDVVVDFNLDEIPEQLEPDDVPSTNDDINEDENVLPDQIITYRDNIMNIAQIEDQQNISTLKSSEDDAEKVITYQETDQMNEEESDSFENFVNTLQESLDKVAESSEDISKQLDDLFKPLLESDSDIADLFNFESKEDKELTYDEIAQFESDENKDDQNENKSNNPSESDDFEDTDSSSLEDLFAQSFDVKDVEIQFNETNNIFEDVESDSVQEETDMDVETVDKEYNKMKEDLNKLFATFDKLNQSSESDSETDDAIVAEEEAKKDASSDDNIVPTVEANNNESREANEDASSVRKATNLFESEVTSAELNNLMVQFALDHGEYLDMKSDNFDRDVAAVRITLNTDEPTVVTSPNYPSPYPTNNIVDWIFQGDGMGIEFNITDFSVNGFLGDYLMVKPGGVDETGHDGLIFSYNLNTARRFRFLDVNTMFVRFEARPGMAFTRGFSFSVKMITPPLEEPEQLPETTELIDAPSETLLIFVGGVVPSQFSNITEEFRLIVADMATLFLNRAADEIGEKTTLEVTQVTQTAVCNINWPGFERCTAVRFGIPLALADAGEYRMSEDDLRDMWNSMVAEDPFAARMRRLGITEFAVPNEESTMLVWVVISIGVVISAAMLGLALWRWSCFEDYTRMAPYSDTDSVISDKKKPLELYPAPHQNLPALYDDDFVKYDYDTTRVDMGGFTNRSYERDAELFDIDSDDDLRALPSTNRDRFTTDV